MGGCTSTSPPRPPTLLSRAGGSSSSWGGRSSRSGSMKALALARSNIPPLIRKSAKVLTVPFGAGIVTHDQREDGIWIVKLNWGAIAYLGNPKDIHPFYKVYAIDCTHHQVGMLVAATMKILWRLVLVDSNNPSNPYPGVTEVMMIHDVVTDNVKVLIGNVPTQMEFAPIPIPSTVEARLDLSEQYILQLRVETTRAGFKYDCLISGTPFGLLPNLDDSSTT